MTMHAPATPNVLQGHEVYGAGILQGHRVKPPNGVGIRGVIDGAWGTFLPTIGRIGR
ncbi:MAG: hypothetical protein ACRC9N_09570 [Aeromonas sp.]